MVQPPTPSDFTWSSEREPHFKRRKEILAEFPEVRKLFGIDVWLKYKVLLVVTLQLAIAIWFLPQNIFLFILLTVTVGSTLGSILFLAIHEVTHDLAFRKKSYNSILAIITNFPLVFPFAMAFKKYHAEHHWKQGNDQIDTDIPSLLEAKTFKGVVGKTIWVMNQIIFYALRPVLTYPMKLDKWQIMNILFQVVFVVIFYFVSGFSGLLYLALSMLFAGGLHPIAGHFIAEHYIFKEGQETYSYYGPWNKLTFNVGYHNEHHDFPNIPGSSLPKLKIIAAKHYDSLYYHTSWSKILFKFIFDKTMTLYSRVKRKG